MLCLKPTASIARNPAQNASRCRDPAYGPQARASRTPSRAGCRTARPWRPPGRSAALPTRAAVATADPGGDPAHGGAGRRRRRGGRPPGRRPRRRAPSSAQPTAPDEAVGVGAADGVGGLHQPDDRRRAVHEVAAVDRVGLGVPGCARPAGSPPRRGAAATGARGSGRRTQPTAASPHHAPAAPPFAPWRHCLRAPAGAPVE